MVRLWEWERLRDLPFQVDLWLPEDSDFLHAGVRIRNRHERTAPVYWWSNIAVPEGARTRVLAPADEAWHFGYTRTMSSLATPRTNHGVLSSRTVPSPRTTAHRLSTPAGGQPSSSTAIQKWTFTWLSLMFVTGASSTGRQRSRRASPGSPPEQASDRRPL